MTSRFDSYHRDVTDIQKRREYFRKRYHDRRAQALAIVGTVCVECGATEKLEFDHIDRATKEYDIGQILRGAPWERIVSELAKCQTLCKDCHKAKTDREQSVGHGQGLTGKKNCRCELCGPLKNAYVNAHNKRRKNKPGGPDGLTELVL